MPGWHQEVQDLVAAGKLQVIGVVQEQHAERCRLYAEWQGLDWPILHDPINLLECNAVPITVAIDEKGIVRSTRPTKAWLRETFLATDVASAGDTLAIESGVFNSTQRLLELQAAATARNDAEAWQSLGDHLMLWDSKRHDLAVDAYRRSLHLQDDPHGHFRLGVALRRRSESSERQAGDFAQAVTHWSAALRGDPNQYIWRRRIQQYGPRLDKPYPFYDWVDEAITDLKKRGVAANLVDLKVPLSGAEIAQPSTKRTSKSDKKPLTSPDPTNRITRDQGDYVKMNATVVRASNAAQAVRVHLSFELTENAVWNNEARPLQVWFDEAAGLSTSASFVEHAPKIAAAESREDRVVDVEFRANTPVEQALTGFVLYYICEKSTNQCILRRQDFSVPIKIE